MPTGFELIRQVETKKLGEELPIVGWFHFPLADPVADDFYAETVNTATAGHWDLIKIMTCGNYMPVAYGADYEFSTPIVPKDKPEQAHIKRKQPS